MKKFFTLCAAAALAVSASAQTVTESKTFDNWYIGVNGGLATGIHPSQLGCGGTWLKDITPNAGIRVGRYFTPVSVSLLRAMFISAIFIIQGVQ